MKLRRHKSIQREVDRRQGHMITHLTVLHICAVEYPRDSVEFPVDHFASGVVNGLKLLKKSYRIYGQRSRQWNLSAAKNFGIYVAAQETSDGNDYLYFIGTPSEIVASLKTVEATEAT